MARRLLVLLFISLLVPIAGAAAASECGALSGGAVRIGDPYVCSLTADCTLPAGFDFLDPANCSLGLAPPGVTQVSTSSGGLGIQGIAPWTTSAYVATASCTCVARRISDGATTSYSTNPTATLVVGPNQPPTLQAVTATAAPPAGAADPTIRQLAVDSPSGQGFAVRVRGGESLSLSLDFLDPEGDPPTFDVLGDLGFTIVDDQITWVADRSAGASLNFTVRPVAFPGGPPGASVPFTVFVDNPYPELIGEGEAAG